MKVLIFHAATTALSAAMVTKAANELRNQGHSVGERNLPAFKSEGEPADLVMFVLSPQDADSFKDRGLEAIATFGGEEARDRFAQVELPDTDEELKDFDFQTIVKAVPTEDAGQITFEQAKAEAVLRGLEVTADTTKAEFEQMLGLSISDSVQAFDRRSDERNNFDGAERRIGVRTSNVLPTVNGVPISRLNAEQLRAAAADMGLKTTATMKDETIINKMTELFAKKVEARDGSIPLVGEVGGDGNSNTPVDPATLEGDALRKVADTEGVKHAKNASDETVRAAIVSAREDKTNG
jgi:hypothetical protein